MFNQMCTSQKPWKKKNDGGASTANCCRVYSRLTSTRANMITLDDQFTMLAITIMTQAGINLKGGLSAALRARFPPCTRFVERLDLIDEGEMPAVDGAAQAELNLQLLIGRFHLVARQM